ncbi:MAG: gamma-glutamyl-gamma-aminobutyrate hydrolase family protein [Chthoniobacterales bacterium]
MPKLATWMRQSDAKWFRPIFAAEPSVRMRNARTRSVSLDDADGLLLTGGPDISAPFLHQPVRDASVIKNPDLERDRWELDAVRKAMARGLPILAICKGMQLFNVALGGTLRLDIPAHNGTAMRDGNIQPLRNDRAAKVRFAKVNSSHHQAVDRPADGCEVESWCATDDVIEQMRLRNYPYALAVQYHPERHALYAPLFADFIAQLKR